MRLSIRHVTTYAYEPATDRCALRLRLYPSVYDAQRVLRWTVSVNGQPVAPLLTTALGDREALWTSQTPLENLEIVAEGEVETTDVAGVVRGLRDTVRPGVFLRETPLTAPDDRIRLIGAGASGPTQLARLHGMSAAVRDAMDYTPGATDARSTASQALKQGAGVCQDHAHVFISAARSVGAPARYVVGYLMSADSAQAETHAWAEAWMPELGWIGFDPANRMCPTDSYVRLSCGLDSVDASPVRGNVAGGPRETLAASVAISQTQSQTQSQGQGQAQGQQAQQQS